MSDQENAPPPPASSPPRKNGKVVKEKRSWENAGGEADLLWNEILEVDATEDGMLKYELPGRGADGYGIHISRVAPTPQSLGSFNGPSAAPQPGDVMSGGNALRQYIINNFHKASGGGPAKYQVRFYIKAKGGTLTQGYLSLPSHSEIAAMMPSPYGGMMGAPQVPPWMGQQQPQMMPQMPPWGWGPPPQQPAPAPPPPAPVAAPPPLAALPPGTDPGVVALISSLQQQIGYLSGQLQQVITKPETPAPTPMPAFVGAPPAPAPAPSGPDQTAMAVLQKLVEWGVIQKPTHMGAPPAVAAPPPPAPGAVGQAAMGQLTEALGVLEQFANLGRTFRATGARVAESFKDPEEEEPPKPDETPKPEDMLPWQRVPIGDNFTWALDKDTGGPSLHGIVAEMMNKPDVRDKVVGLADKALDLGREFMSRTKGPVPSSAAPQLVAGPPQAPPQGNQGGGWGPGT